METYSIYVHIPFCQSRCVYCDFVSNTCEIIPFEKYTNKVNEELRWRQSQIAKPMALRSVYLGGGTPSLWPADKLGEILQTAVGSSASDVEVTVEINPGDVDSRWVASLLGAGVNRFSIGVQAMDETRLQWLGRRHTVVEAVRAVDVIREAGCENISVDFIYGTPMKTVEEMEQDLLRLCALDVQHISAYELTIAEGTPLANMEKSQLVSDDVLTEMWHRLGEVLCAHGYNRYEVSNYARTGFESRHNKNYWQGGQYLGIGSGAHGFVTQEEKRFRYSNGATLEKYLNASLENQLFLGDGFFESVSDESFAKELMMLGFRCRAGIDKKRMDQLVGGNQLFGETLEALIDEGYLQRIDEKYIPSPTAMLLADTLALRFF